MKIKALFLSLCLSLLFILSACTGYNNIMYRHLSDENNYETYTVAIESIYVSNKENGKLEEYDPSFHDESYLRANVYFAVSELEGFYGGEYFLGDGSTTKHIVLLEVLAENSEILLNNNFYKDFLPGNVLQIQSSDWVYMDRNYYYVIGVRYGDTQYLDSEVGLQHVIDMMDDDRSFF